MHFKRYLIPLVLLVGLGLKPDNNPLKPAPAWNIQFNSDIRWQQVSPLGDLVISTSDGLHGIDTQTGQKSWEISWLSNVPYENFQQLPGTFFAEVVLPNAIVIIDPYDGRIVGNTKEAGFKDVIAKNLLYESGTLLVYGFKDNLQGYLSVFDVNTGAELWSNSEIFGKPKNKLGGLINTLQVASELDAQEGKAAFDVIEVSKDNFIIATATGLFSVTTKTGEVKWTAKLPAPKGAVSATTSSKLIKSTSSEHFYFAKSNYIMAHNVKDGAQVWKQVTKISGLVSEVIQYRDGLILLPEIDPSNTMFAPKLNYVNAQTGEKTWGKNNKGLKLPGGVIDYQWVKGGIVLAMQSGEKSFLNILDPEKGVFKFLDDLKIKGELDYTEMTPSGLLYFTKANQYGKGEVNIFDLQTGEPRFSKSITSKFKEDSENQTLVRDFRENIVYVYTDDSHSLYEINLENGMLRLLREDLKLEGKETVKNVEVRDQGILLSSQQNVLMLDYQGKQLFQNYYPAPTEPGIVKALYAMESITAALYSAQSHMIAASFDQISDNVTTESGRALVNEISDAYQQQGRELQAYSSSAMKRAKARFKATKEGNDHIYMMIALDKQKTGVAKALEGRKFALVRVSKDTGEITEVIDMQNEKEPSYQVDNISNSVFYRNQPHQIISYRF